MREQLKKGQLQLQVLKGDALFCTACSKHRQDDSEIMTRNGADWSSSLQKPFQDGTENIKETANKRKVVPVKKITRFQRASLNIVKAVMFR